METVRYIHGILRKALADAMRKGSVQRNVADPADPPKLSSAPKPQMKVWTAEQLREFLDGIRDHELYPAFYLAANTGMRRGEILGIRWEDIDLQHKRLSVRQTVLNIKYKVVIADGKTPRSRRTVDLEPRGSAEVVGVPGDQLKALRSAARRELRRLLGYDGKTYVHGGFLLVTCDEATEEARLAAAKEAVKSMPVGIPDDRSRDDSGWRLRWDTWSTL